ncbi:MAG TPA: uracil-DNA glycosylase [Clostridia bacterium]|nr:uracil-DNA glycosylase [Clostridia bacterium]
MHNNLNELKAMCESCQKCSLSESRTNVVFGEGVDNAEVFFIGEGPGEQEDLSGKPFIGRGGKLLDKYLDAIDLHRDKNMYIANIVKCRPPENRNPNTEEQEACIDWLRDQVRIIRPKIIVCLGRVAALRIISPDFKVTVQHGEFFKKGGILMMGTFHPAALLRNPNRKPTALEDFLKLRDKIQEVCERTYD